MDVEVGEAGVDEGGVVGAQVQVDGDRLAGDVQGAGRVEEVSPDPFRGGGLVAGQLAGERAVEVAADDGQRGVEINVERHAGGERVEVEAAEVGVGSFSMIMRSA
jgi:hypothetical protein